MSLYLGGKLVAGATNTDGSSVRNLGEIVQSTVPVVDAGLHLLDGSLINGNGIYSNFVQEITKLYTANPNAPYFAHGESITTYNYGSVGNVINDNGVISNFLYSLNFAMVSVPNNPTTSMELVIKFKQSTLASGDFVDMNVTGHGLLFRINDTAGNIRAWGGNSGGWNVLNNYATNVVADPNIWTYIKLTWSGTEYTFYQSSDGINWIEKSKVTTASAKLPIDFNGYMCLGGSLRETRSFPNGSIDLNECYLNIDGNRAWTGTTVTQRSAEEVWEESIMKYGMCDQFVYTPATENTPAMVRLPKYGNQLYSTLDSTIPVTGNGMALGCSNGAYDCGLEYISGGYILACQEDYGRYPQPSRVYTGKPTYGVLGVTQDPRFSGLISNLDKIGTSSNCFYYIVVATSIKTDVEIDIGEITVDLDQKVDKNELMEVQCVIESYQDGYSWYRIWSDGWCEQGSLTDAVTGKKNIVLHKPYKNSTYSIRLDGVRYPSATDVGHSSITDVTEFGFAIYDWYGYGTYWSTGGYLRV